jgi:PAS domain S-box-containing protein
MISRHAQLNKSHNILLVEDDIHYANLVKILLSEADILQCTITHATTFAEGQEILRSRSHLFAAVLLDLRLPDSEGFETLSRLLHQFPKLNVIVLTAQSDKALGVEAVKTGAQDFLIKGEFDAATLAKALRYSIERNQILLRLEETQQLARIGHWECSPTDHAFVASDEVYHILGDSFDKLISCEEVMDPNSPFHILGQIQLQTQKEGKVEHESWITRSDGEQRFITIVCTASSAASEELIFSGIIQDITERKQAEELRKARELDQHIAKEREQFIASISHEMRTPMNAILGMSNLLLKGQLGDEQQEFIQAIQYSSEVLLNIINDILDTSALQNHQLKFTAEPFQLRELLYHLINLMKYKLVEKELNVTIDVHPDIPDSLIGDSNRLNQILYNLIGNAIKFTEEGSVSIIVNPVHMDEETVHLQFEIQDTGIGISLDAIDKIFSPFGRINHQGKVFEGSGLGLPIAKLLVEQQGGKITVDSQPGQGSTFTFNLHYKHTKRAYLAVEKKASMSIDPTFRILIAEDHMLNLVVTKKTIEKQWPKVTIFTAANGDEVIELLQRQEIDIILMDIQMPVRDGFSTTHYIRHNMPAPISQIPILAVTAHANIAKQEQYPKAGFNGFILKPFQPEQLFCKIQTCLGDVTEQEDKRIAL